MTESAVSEIRKGQRFGFGANWARFLAHINEDKIRRAEQSLLNMLECGSLEGRSFLDIGSGSGLFSLAARRLGARVHSFDFDPDSVSCTLELKRRYFESDDMWVVEQGSVLDEAFISSLSSHDVIYSWGVLHHTGQMWNALQAVASLTKPGARLYIAIYNTQIWTPLWRRIKIVYNRAPRFLRGPYLWTLFAFLETRSFVFNLLAGTPGRYFRTRLDYDPVRGMSRWSDFVDWIGGLPFETASPEEIFDFYRKRSFSMLRMRTCGGGLGCNEFVFLKQKDKGD